MRALITEHQQINNKIMRALIGSRGTHIYIYIYIYLIIIINTESVNNNGATNIYIRIGTDVANLLTKIHFS